MQKAIQIAVGFIISMLILIFVSIPTVESTLENNLIGTWNLIQYETSPLTLTERNRIESTITFKRNGEATFTGDCNGNKGTWTYNNENQTLTIASSGLRTEIGCPSIYFGEMKLNSANTEKALFTYETETNKGPFNGIFHITKQRS